MGDLLFSAFQRILRPVGIVMRPRAADNYAATATGDLSFPLVDLEHRLFDSSNTVPHRVPGIRSFFGDTMKEAMRKAESALGPDAVILNARTSDPALRTAGAYEVVCAAHSSVASTVRGTPREEAGPSALARELAELRLKVEELRARLAYQQSPAEEAVAESASPVDSVASRQTGVLHEAGLSVAMAQVITEAAIQCAEARSSAAGMPTPAGGDLEILPSDLEEALTKLLATPYLALNQKEGHQIHVLIGAEEGAETAVALQFANEFYAQRAGGVRLLRLELESIADEGRSRLTQETRVPFEVFQEVSSLRARLLETNPAEIVVLEAPSIKRWNLEDTATFGQMLHYLSNSTVHLVLPAQLNATAQREAVVSAGSFAPTRLLFSRLDRGQLSAGAIEAILVSQKPASFVCGGTADDGFMQAATPGLLAHLFVNYLEQRSVVGCARHRE